MTRTCAFWCFTVQREWCWGIITGRLPRYREVIVYRYDRTGD